MNTINEPSVLFALQQVCEQYERALVEHDFVTLDALFWHDERVVRFGLYESLYGFDSIASFRRARSVAGIARERKRVVVTCFEDRFGTYSAEDLRENGRVGRVMQTWMRMDDGWKVVAAHVSVIAGATNESSTSNQQGT